MLGRLAMERQDWQAALQHFDVALGLEENNPLNWYLVVLSTWRSVGADAAVARVEAARAGGVDLGGLAQANRSDWQGAGSALERALGLAPLPSSP
jgi:hypothetical protein